MHATGPSAPPVSETVVRWPVEVVVLHWLTFVMLAALFTLAFAVESLDDRVAHASMLSWHRLAGVAAFTIAVARLAWRAASNRPAHSLPPVKRLAAACVHASLYLLLLAAPVLGYLSTCARLGHVDLPGMLLPAVIGKDRALAETLEDLHRGVGWIMLVLIGLHVAAALWHHWGARDKVLLRMLGR